MTVDDGGRDAADASRRAAPNFSGPNAKPFQIQTFFLQAFPRIPLAIFWDFKGLHGSKPKFDVSKLFRLRGEFKGPPHGAKSIGIVEATWKHGSTGFVFPKEKSTPLNPEENRARGSVKRSTAAISDGKPQAKLA